MVGIQLKVSPDALKVKADQISGQVQKIENHWQKIYDLVKNSKSYWEGEASDFHRRYLKENDDDAKKLLKRLREHPEDLKEMAGIYEKAEEQAMRMAAVLPDDVIV